MAAIAGPEPAVTLRRGPPYWLASYWAMTRWHLAALRMWVMLVLVIQVMAGAGFVLGIALFFAHIPAIAALFVCTGVPVINLVMIGLIGHMAVIVRAGLTAGLVTGVASSYLIVAAWAVAGAAAAGWALGRRG